MERLIRCIAIDDEPPALTVIESFCRRRGGIELSTYSEPGTGIDAIRRLKPQIVFLDMRMNGISGLDIARYLVGKCSVIFTTAYEDFALSGFELDAADFLHKPFSYERFCHAVDKALVHVDRTMPQPPEMIMVKQEYKEIPVSPDRIAYVQAMGNYIRIFLDDGGCIVSRTSLKSILDILPADRFIRIHKSYIVPAAKVKGFTKGSLSVAFSGKTKDLPVGRAYREVLGKLAGVK